MLQPDKVIRIIIADDHQIIIDGIKALLDDVPDIEIIGEALNGEALLEQLKVKKPDIVLLDISMPVMDGITAARRMNEEYPDIQILVLSTHDERRLIHEIWKMGIESYVVKSASKEEMIKAINIIASGGSYFSKAIKDKLRRITSDDMGYSVAVHPISLTKRELQILKLLAMEYTGEEVAKELFISKNTVETHRKNLFRKTKSRTTIGLVKFAIKHNIV